MSLLRNTLKMLRMMHVVGLFLVTSHMAIVFLFSGLLLNFFQLLIYLILYNRNRRLYRKINYYLLYFVWSQIVTVYEWISNSKCNMYGDEESLQMLGKEHCITVMNHTYDIEGVICSFIANDLKMLGNYKSCLKKELCRIPVIGWAWWFAEDIFLERNWEKDKLMMGESLDNLAKYEDPINLLFYCEGTRFTPHKHQNSMEFAKSKNLPFLQHHLCPRTRGFNFTAKHVKGKIPVVYNLQLGIRNSAKEPTFANLLMGYSFTADVYLERIPIDRVPTESDEATSKWLHALYQKKDKLMDDYYRTQIFPGKCVRINRSYRTLANSVFWALFIGIPWFYLIHYIFVTGNVFLISFISSVFVLLFTVIYFMMRATKADTGSTYGMKKSSEKERE